MRRQLRIEIARAENGLTIHTRGDDPADNGLFIAKDAAEAVAIAKQQIEKSLAVAPAPAPATK